MDSKSIIAALDAEIKKLKEARTLLARHGVTEGIVSRPSREVKKRRKKRNLTPEGRARIAEAVRKRWAAQKRAAAK